MPTFRHKNNLAIAVILFATVAALGFLAGDTAFGLLVAATTTAAVTLLWGYLIDAAVWGLKVLIGALSGAKEKK